ncbi:hypothetical protein Q31b_36800 [Novipirellula aureliae]|uniref:DUF4350 domain-containing protein n=1 Tax=Novipirellula aureliae TaxID=2527966 RepID=A0A5C6DUF3_9BACT|nr:hypothetical protein [Novipirellula aureliae]TWU40332.1 hypothetical protein Q31b_36800 [Novipirellula aureliae]
MIRRRHRYFIVILCCVGLVGCNRLSTDYGQSAGYMASQSLNGFGALRQTYINAGADDLDVRRLTDRVQRLDTIVWTPTYSTAIGTEVTFWFDSWLRRDKRTLVYIVPDSGSEADYWSQAIEFALPDQRLEYRRRAARSTNERIQWRLNRVPIASNGWFELEPLVERRQFDTFRGRWAKQLEAVDETDDPRATPLQSEYGIEPYRDTDRSVPQNQPANAANQGSATPIGPVGPTAPGSPNWNNTGTATPTGTEVMFMPVLMDDAGKTVIARITSKKWRDSQIIVVGGGSLLTNYAFTHPTSVRLADKIVHESLLADTSPPKVGFTSIPPAYMSVSSSKPGVPKATGMELLTVWPVSLITIHAVLLGIVVCLMLIPSLGRPKRVRYHATSHFGAHLDAVAELMNRAKGETFARSRISDYFRRVHGETTGQWIIEEPTSQEVEPKEQEANESPQ